MILAPLGSDASGEAGTPSRLWLVIPHGPGFHEAAAPEDPMKAILTLAAAVALASCAGGRPGTATRYRPAGLFGGYSDEVIAPGEWQVTGRSNGVAEPGFGRNMAMYRAAELVKAAGFSHMQVLDQQGRENRMNGRTIGESLELEVRGANGPAPPAVCRARSPQACFTAPVDEIMARLRPLLHIDPAPVPGAR
jgi:hypothetical protein